MEKTINKKTITRLSTFILIITLLIPLSTHLFDEKISKENQVEEVNLELNVIIGDPSARLDVYPDVAIRDRDTIHVTGYLTAGGGTIPLPGETIIALWNGSYIDEGITGSDGYYNIPLEPTDTMYGDAGKIFGHVNVTAWFQGSEWYPYERWANKTIEVYAVTQLSLTLNPTVLKNNDTFTATTTVRFDNGTAIAGADVYLRLWPGNDTEYYIGTTNGVGAAYFDVTINTTESPGVKPVTGALDVSTVASDTTYIKGKLGSNTYDDFWSNNTKTIRVVEEHTITFTLTASSRVYRDIDWVQLDGYFEDKYGNGKQGETVYAALEISGTYQRIIYANDTADINGHFFISFQLPYQFYGYTVNVGDISITVLPDLIWDNTTFPCICDTDSISVVSGTDFNNVDKDLDFYYRGESLSTNGNLYDDQNNPVASEFVSAFLTNQSIGYSSPTYTDQTDGSGSFDIWVDTSSVPAGNRSCFLNVTFSGTFYYDPSFFTPLITVNFFANPDFTEILLGGIAIDDLSTLEKSTDYDVEARLVDEFGRPITGRTVEIFWDGNSILNTTTDVSGKVYPSFTTSDYSTDLLPLQFTFDYLGGSQQYIETYDFSLNNRAPTIDSFSADLEEVELGESCTISVSGTDDGPLSNVTLVLTDPDGNETRVIQQVTTSLNFDVQFIIDTSQSEYNILGNWTFYLIVTDREGDSRISDEGQFTVIEKEGMNLGDLTLVVAIIAANVLAAISGYFIAGKIRAKGGLGPFLQSLKNKFKK